MVSTPSRRRLSQIISAPVISIVGISWCCLDPASAEHKNDPPPRRDGFEFPRYHPSFPRRPSSSGQTRNSLCTAYIGADPPALQSSPESGGLSGRTLRGEFCGSVHRLSPAVGSLRDRTPLTTPHHSKQRVRILAPGRNPVNNARGCPVIPGFSCPAFHGGCAGETPGLAIAMRQVEMSPTAFRLDLSLGSRPPQDIRGMLPARRSRPRRPLTTRRRLAHNPGYYAF